MPPAPMVGPNSWIGTGAAVEDYDNDGDLDVYVIDTFGWANQLWRNNGDKTFTNVSAGSGLGDTGSGRMALFLDLDNDGDQDLVLGNDTQGYAGLTSSKLFRNDGGAFTDVSTGSGFDPQGKFVGGIGATDYNDDGLLDLYVTFWDVQGVPYNYFYRNTGGFTFVDETLALGLRGANTQKQTWAPVFVDVNLDGRQDLYGAVDFDLDYLYLRNGNGFQDYSVQADVFHDGQDPAGNDMGVAIGDVDGDGDLDIFTTNIAFPLDGTGKINALFMNHWPQPYTDEALERGCWNSYWGWGAVFTDIDFDGDLDLSTVGGRGAGDGGLWSDKPKQLYQNDGTGHFVDIAMQAGFNHTGNSRGLVAFDYDADGDEELLIVNVNQPMAFFENVTQHTSHYFVLKLVGTARTRDAVGAKIRLTVGETTQVRERIAGGSFFASLPRQLHFGVGSATVIDRLEVDWPGGAQSVVENLPVDQLFTLTEGQMPAPVLLTLDINGSTIVPQNSSTNFFALGTFHYAADGDVTTQVQWSVVPQGAASISPAGVLTTGEVEANEEITVRATLGGMTASLDVTVTPGATADVTAPTVAILTPTSSNSHVTPNASVTLAGTAMDQVGVSGVTWTSTTGAAGDCTGTANWTCGPIPLENAGQTITVEAADAAGNTGSDALMVTRQTSSGAPPVLVASTSSVDLGDDRDTATVRIWATGSTALAYMLMADQPWISVDPASGTSMGALDFQTHEVRVDRTTFEPGAEMSGEITAAPADPQVSPLTIAVLARAADAGGGPAPPGPDPGDDSGNGAPGSNQNAAPPPGAGGGNPQDAPDDGGDDIPPDDEPGGSNVRTGGGRRSTCGALGMFHLMTLAAGLSLAQRGRRRRRG